MFKMGLRFPSMSLLLILFLGFLFLGLYDSPVSIFHIAKDVKVGAEYTNSLLTVSSILFGFWMIIISNKPKHENLSENFFFKTTTIETFYLCFGFLVLSVVFLTLTAIGLYSSAFALVFTSLSCILNSLFLTIFVRHYAIMDSD